MSEPVLSLFSKVTTLIFDIDGVLTDGSITLMPNGDQIRKMNIKDGYALQLAVKKGLNIAIISGGSSELAKQRLNGLGIEHVYLKSENKLETLKDYLAEQDVSAEQVLYMGDDIPDFEVMTYAMLPTCPNDAVEEIKSIAKYISPKNGGEGCVRDVIEKVMKIKGIWFEATSKFEWA